MIILGTKYPLTPAEVTQLELAHERVDIVSVDTSDEETRQRITHLITMHRPKYIVLNLDKSLSFDMRSYLEELDFEGIIFLTFSQFAPRFLERKLIEFNEHNLAVLQSIRHDRIRKMTKRFFDFGFAVFAMILFLPLYLIIAILIKLRSPESPVIFTQQRLGLNGKFFRVYKFRTMVPNAETVLKKLLAENPTMREEYLTFRKLKNDPRIIAGIGHFLRRSSLDELPQFFNVLLGDMSIVGPRPYIHEEFVNHSPEFVEIITSVKPGITGFWQVTERNEDIFDRRVEKDIQYIRDQNFWLDIYIIYKTVLVMLFRRGA